MRRALVTGANGGIGGAVTDRLLRAGFEVHAVVRQGRSRLAAHVVDHPRLIAHDVDLVEFVQDPRRLVDGPLHALVNVAGSSVYGSAGDVPIADLRALFELNVMAPAAMVQSHLDPLIEGSGTVVQISSLSAALPLPWMGAYAASKQALEAWSESLRHELRPLGVRVVCLQPGTYDTGIARRLRVVPCSRESQQAPLAAFEALVARSLTRAANPSELGDAVLSVLDAPSPPLRRRMGPGSWGLPWLRALPSAWRDLLIDRVLTHTPTARMS